MHYKKELNIKIYNRVFKKSSLNQEKPKWQNSLLITTLAGFLVSGLVTYFVNEHTREKAFCIQEIKGFNINNFSFKDISLLNKECKPYIKEFELFEDIIFSKSTNKTSIRNFSQIINELHDQGKISKEEILNFSDIYLNKMIKNDKYKFSKQVKSIEKDNKRKLDHFIHNYLFFKKDISSNISSTEEIENYVYITRYFTFFKNFYKESILKKGNTTYYLPFPGDNRSNYIHRSIDFFSLNKITFFEPTNQYKYFEKNYKKIPFSILQKIKTNNIEIQRILDFDKFLKNKDIDSISRAIVIELDSTYIKDEKMLSKIDILDEMSYRKYIFKLFMYKLSSSEISNKEKVSILNTIIRKTKVPREYLFNYNAFYNDLFQTFYQFSNDNELLTSFFLKYIDNRQLNERILRIISFNEHVEILNHIYNTSYDEEYKQEVYSFLIHMLNKNTLKKDVNISKLRDLKKTIFTIYDNLSTKNDIALYASNSLNINHELYPKMTEYFLEKLDQTSDNYLNLLEKKSNAGKTYYKSLLLRQISSLNNEKLSTNALVIKFKLLVKLNMNQEQLNKEFYKLRKIKNLPNSTIDKIENILNQ